MLGLHGRALCCFAALLSLGIACSPDDGDDGTSGNTGGQGSGGGSSSTGGSNTGATGGGGNGSGSSGGGSSGGASGGTGGELDQRLLDLYTLYCTRLFECPVSNDDSAWLRSMFESPEECGRSISDVIARQPDARLQAQGLAAGKLVLSDENLATALDRLSTCQGFTISEKLNLQQLLVEGTVELGGPCRSEEECAGSAYCAAADGACGGKCVAKVALGADCTDNAECDETTGPARCRYDAALDKDVCQPYFGAAVDVDEPCDDPTAATGTHLCPEGLWCDVESGAAPVCREPYAAGEECFGGDSACEPGYVCAPLEGDGTWRCSQPQIVNEAGAPCDDETAKVEQYGSCNSFLGLYCAGGTCESHLDGDVGDPCVGVDIIRTMSCREGLYCDSSDKCALLLPEGVACAESDSCTGVCKNTNGEGTCAPAVCTE